MFKSISEMNGEDAEKQIIALQKVTDYEIREWPIEVLVSKFTEGRDEDNAEIFIPDYQRDLVWTPKQQSRFIESILIRLPIPFIFVADTQGDRAGQLEVIDGSQRLRTLEHFLSNRLQLVGLVKLSEANGLVFNDLPKPRQLRFKRQTVRVIEMTDQADEDARREMFDRLNSGGTKLKDMEIRRGAQDGPFMDFIEDLAALPEFQVLVPVSERNKKHREHEELVLRFFAYVDGYTGFKKSVQDFLNDYLAAQNKAWDVSKADACKAEFQAMLAFVRQYFKFGFLRSGYTTISRIRFEALAVGTALALRKQPDLKPENTDSWVNSLEFIKHTRSDASNSRPKIVNRFHFVRDKLLGRPVEYDLLTKSVEASANLDVPEDMPEPDEAQGDLFKP